MLINTNVLRSFMEKNPFWLEAVATAESRSLTPHPSPCFRRYDEVSARVGEMVGVGGALKYEHEPVSTHFSFRAFIYFIQHVERSEYNFQSTCITNLDRNFEKTLSKPSGGMLRDYE